jgi:hypothetical protein
MLCSQTLQRIFHLPQLQVQINGVKKILASQHATGSSSNDIAWHGIIKVCHEMIEIGNVGHACFQVE